MPVRVGFRPTSSMVTSEPGSADAATIQNAADEISPGTTSVAAAQPLAARDGHGPINAATRVAPNACSARSV